MPGLGLTPRRGAEAQATGLGRQAPMEWVREGCWAGPGTRLPALLALRAHPPARRQVLHHDREGQLAAEPGRCALRHLWPSGSWTSAGRGRAPASPSACQPEVCSRGQSLRTCWRRGISGSLQDTQPRACTCGRTWRAGRRYPDRRGRGRGLGRRRGRGLRGGAAGWGGGGARVEGAGAAG